MIRYAFLIPAVLTLAACVAPVKEVTALPPEALSGMNLQSVSAGYSKIGKQGVEEMDAALEKKATENPEAAAKNAMNYKAFNKVLPQIVKDRLIERGMAHGMNVNIDIQIDKLRLADPAMAFFLGDMDQLSGFVYIKDARTNKVIGEYYADALESKAGIIGAATSGLESRQRLAKTFADHIGDQLKLQKVKVVYESNNNE